MASFVVTGHPLNYADMGVSPASADALRALMTAGVGTTVNLTLPGPDATMAKAQGVLK
jgi:hypothetical protein